MLPDTVIDILVFLMPILPVLYLVLQIVAVLKMRAKLRIAAALCGLAMSAIILFVLWASAIMESNIAPIYIAFALPVLTTVLILLWILHLFRPYPPDTRQH